MRAGLQLTLANATINESQNQGRRLLHASKCLRSMEESLRIVPLGPRLVYPRPIILLMNPRLFMIIATPFRLIDNKGLLHVPSNV